MSANEKSNESIGDIISDMVQSVSEAVADVIETVEDGVQAILNPEESKKESTATNEKVEQNANEESINEETRIGYLQTLPQPEEPEEEAISQSADDADARNEIEAAIARARETSPKAIEIEKDDLVAESLPELPSFNTAKLYIQSPNRVFLYWNLSGNPFETLQKAFGSRANNYQLVIKLINLQTKAESFAPASPGGNWWYNVRSNTKYRVDLGFYAANRPFIRLLSSNPINTPRAAPSSRADTEDDWIVSNKQFVQILTASGYSHDVLGVAFGADTETGDVSEDASTLVAANHFAPLIDGELDLAELRWLLVSLASGVAFADLRSLLSPAALAWLGQVLEANSNALERENVRTVLESIFGSEFVEMFTDENAVAWMRLAPVAIGASAINFPEILFPQLRLPELRAALVETPFDEQFGEDDFSPGALFVSSAEFIN